MHMHTIKYYMYPYVISTPFSFQMQSFIIRHLLNNNVQRSVFGGRNTNIIETFRKIISYVLYFIKITKNEVQIMKAILTTVGEDQVGIIAGVSQYLAENRVNILDLSQTIMDGYFTMMMMVEVPENGREFGTMARELADLGQKLGVEIRIRNEEIYRAMHQL